MISKALWFLFLAFILPLSASEVNLFQSAQIYIDKENLSFKEIQQKHFSKISEDHINLGFKTDTSIWIKFHLNNISSTTKKTVLKIDNPLLEHITLYDQNHSYIEGMLHINPMRTTLYPSFNLNFSTLQRANLFFTCTK